MRALCGTSGYNYDEWAGSFYPDGLAKTKRLAYYASQLPTVEINYSFYRKPTKKALASWAEQTPPGFKFALKAWQKITHHQRLRDCGELVAVFWEAAQVLGDKLAPILFQLPPNLKRDDELLHGFLEVLPPSLPAAFEFRHASWLDGAVFDRLRRAGAALCVADDEKLTAPVERTAPFGYFRLRREDYTEKDIAAWADRIRQAGGGGDVFIYFKHEDAAKGTAFARAMQKLLTA